MTRLKWRECKSRPETGSTLKRTGGNHIPQRTYGYPEIISVIDQVGAGLVPIQLGDHEGRPYMTYLFSEGSSARFPSQPPDCIRRLKHTGLVGQLQSMPTTPDGFCHFDRREKSFCLAGKMPHPFGWLRASSAGFGITWPDPSRRHRSEVIHA